MAQSSFATFLGFGIVRPFQRDGKNDIHAAGGLENVQACVGQILGTQCSNENGEFMGEVPWNPDFGSLLYRLKHKKGPELQSLAYAFVADALKRWEPRVIVKFTTVTFDNATRTCTIFLIYDVISQNVPGNNVIFPNVEQTVFVPLAA